MGSKNWNLNKLCLSGAVVLTLLSGCKDSEFSHRTKGVSTAQFFGPASQPNIAAVRWQKIDAASMQSICSHRSLRELSICGGTRDGSPIFPQLSTLPNLEMLNIVEFPLTDDELAGLSDAPNLSSVELSRTGISGHGLQHLAKLPLKRLVIRDRQLSLEGLQAIASMTGLEELELCIPGIHLADMPTLASNNTLRSVIIAEGQFSFREYGGLKFLLGASKLTDLQLSGVSLNDRSLKPICSLSSLQNLTIGKSVISEEGIKFLSSLEHLHSLDVPSLPSLQNALRLADANGEVVDEAPLPRPIRG